MRILIGTGIYPPDIGGPATYSKLIFEELKSRGYGVSVLTYGNKITNYELGITTISKKHSKFIRYFLYFLAVLKLGKKADIIYLMDPVNAGLPATLANLFLKKKLVLKMVGDYAWEQARQITNYKLRITNLDNFYPFNKKHSFKIKLFQKIENWVAKKTNKIIVPSFYLRGILINGWMLPQEKIEVIYNSFNTQEISNKRQEAGGGGERTDRFNILSVGRLVSWKGFDTLIDVVRDLPNVKLTIVGDGPEYDNYKLQITNYKLQDKIKLLGKLSHYEVAQKMCSADLFVLNSAYEGLSHTILEAMAYELPVLASRIGGNIELLGETEERGYLFEYNNKEQIKNKILKIIRDREDAEARAKKAKDFVFGFGKKKMIDSLERLFSRL